MSPEGTGVGGYETLAPVPKSFKGTLGQVVAFDPRHGVNLTGSWFSPFEKIKVKQVQDEIDRIKREEGGFTVIRIVDGPLQDELINQDLVEFEVVSALEALAQDEADHRSDIWPKNRPSQ